MNDSFSYLRKKARVTLANVAEACGVSVGYVSYWQSKDNVPVAHHETVAELLGVHPSVFAKEIETTTLRGKRKAAGLTQHDVATALGVRLPTVAMWEARNEIPAYHHEAVAALYGIPVDEVRNGDGVVAIIDRIEKDLATVKNIVSKRAA